MAAPFTRASLGRGPAQVTFNGVTFFTRDDISAKMTPTWKPVVASMYGQVDSVISDRVYKVPLRLWGAWENLTTLFPAAVMTPVIGASVFSSTTDATLTIWARNGDKLVYTSAAITKVANLYLGVDSDLFAADVEFSCIRGNTNNPEDANAYYTASVSQALTESAFAKTNFKKVRWTGAWGALGGFTSFVAQKGWQISWEMEVKGVPVDGYGTSDFGLEKFIGQCKCIPVGPTIAQLEAQAADQGVALGALLSGISADLTITGDGGGSVVLKNAGLKEHGYVFGTEPLRLGECTFETTRGFEAGVAAAVATVG
jgi:hypothetical protein